MTIGNIRAGFLSTMAAALIAPIAGCGLDLEDIELDDIELKIVNAVNELQDDDPRDVDLPADLAANGDTVIINNNVTIINNVHDDIVIAELPDLLLVGFENITGFDAFIRYEADGVAQGIFVFDGETLLLEYPCLQTLDLVSEDHFDVNSGVLVESFDLVDFLFDIGADWQCGDAFIITFDPFAVGARTELIDLLE